MSITANRELGHFRQTCSTLNYFECRSWLLGLNQHTRKKSCTWQKLSKDCTGSDLHNFLRIYSLIIKHILCIFQDTPWSPPHVWGLVANWTGGAAGSGSIRLDIGLLLCPGRPDSNARYILFTYQRTRISGAHKNQTKKHTTNDGISAHTVL